MELEKLVPSFDTCYEMYKAGFKNRTFFYYDGGELTWIPNTKSKSILPYLPAPTLGEIELPIRHYIERRNKGYYIRLAKSEVLDIEYQCFKTEVEARARLWIYLNI